MTGRSLRRLGLFAALVVGALLVVALAGGAWLLRSDSGRATLAGWIEQAASTPGDTVLAIGSLDGALPSEIMLRDVTVADADGVWLTLHEARLEWRPWSLVGRRFDVVSLAVDGLDIARAPVAGTAAPSEPLPREIVLPQLPVDVRLAALSLEHVTLGEALVGEAVAIRASGQFGSDRSGDARGRLSVERTDGAPLTASLDTALDAATRTLEIDLDIAEPAGGVIARLAGLPDLPAVSLTLKGRGPADAWQGRLAAEATGLAALNADVSLALGARPTVALVGSADIAGLERAGVIDGAVLALTGPVPQFDIAAAFDEDGDTLFVERAQLTGAAIEASVSGSVGLDSLASDLKATARLTDPAIVGRFAAGVAVAAASADIALSGTPDRLRYTATVTVDGASASGLRTNTIAGRFDGVVQPTRITGGQEIRVSGLSGDDPAFAVLPPQFDLKADTILDLADQTVEVTNFALTGSGFDVAGAGRLGLVDGALRLDATATADRLAPYAALAGLDLDGRMDASVAVTGEAFGDRADGTVSVKLTELASNDLPLAPTVGRAATLTAKLTGASASGVTVSEFAVSGDNLSVSGSATLEDNWQMLTASVNVADHRLVPWSESAGIALAGQLRARAAVSGSVADPKAELTLDLADVGVDGIGLLGGEIRAAGATLVSAPAGTVTAALTGPAGPVSLKTRFSLPTPERLALDDIAASIAGARADGAVAVDLARGLADGRIDITARGLAPLGALVGVSLTGELNARLDLVAADDQRAVLTARADTVSVTPPEGTSITAKGLDLRGELIGLKPEPAGRVKIAAASISGDGLALSAVNLGAEGTAQRIAFTAVARGTEPAQFDASLAGNVMPAGGGWSVGLDRLDGALAGEPVTLRVPARLTMTPQALTLTPLDMTLASGVLRAEATLDATRAQAQAEISDLPLSFIGGLAAGAPKLGGTLSVEASLSGAAANPSGDAKVRFAGVTASGIDAASNVTLQGDITARLRDGRLALDGDVGGFAERGLALEASLPLTLSAWPFATALPADGAIDGTLVWNGEVATLWEALPLDGHRVSGVADISVRTGGTVGAPLVSGNLGFADGRYENLDIGTVLDKLTIDATVDEGRRLAIVLDATDGGAGTLSGKGNVALDPLQAFPTDVALTFRDATLVRRDELTLAANGDLKLAGDARAMTLDGRIETTRIEARIDNNLPPSVVDLGVVEASAPPPEKTVEEEAGLLTLDLDIVVPGQAFVRGRGLDSEWSGTLRVTGDAEAPMIAGTMSFVRGQFNFAGKRFTLDDSTITFDGTAKIDPLLDIRAAHKADEVTAVINISGRSSNPSIKLSSTPSLPQDEVLSRVLFGKGAGSLSPVETLQLAAAVAQLSGQGPGGAGILDKVRETLGVDVLEVGASDSGGANLRAGRYIDERTFVGVTQGTEPGSTGVTVEIELLPNIVVDTEVDQTGTNKSGIKWKWDY